MLVDEFQDTDPVQYDIVLLLAEEPERGAADPYAAKLTPGKLFVVGDAKQSIYRFRGADLVACRRVIKRLEDQGAEALTLTTNFRSLPPLLEPLNGLFSQLFAGDDPHQAPFSRLEAPGPVEASLGPLPIEIWTHPNTKGNVEKRRDDEEGRSRPGSRGPSRQTRRCPKTSRSCFAR